MTQFFFDPKKAEEVRISAQAYMRQYIKEYIEDDQPYPLDPDFLQELKDWAKEYDRKFLYERIMTIYHKCRILRHDKWADEIYAKYRDVFMQKQYTSDSIIAFKMLLESAQTIVDGYESIVYLNNVGRCGLRRMAFTVGLFCGIDTEGNYKFRYCYATWRDAAQDLAVWNGEDHPPGNWIKRKGAGPDIRNPNLESKK